MPQQHPVLKMWQRLAGFPGGRWLFSRLLCLRVPYFATVRPVLTELAPFHAEARVRKRRRVQNHLGTVHVIAACNLAELVAGTMMEVSLPATHRWIPCGMETDYLQKATTDLYAVARLDPETEFGEAREIPVAVSVRDRHDREVVRARIRMWVTPRPDRRS